MENLHRCASEVTNLENIFEVKGERVYVLPLFFINPVVPYRISLEGNLAQNALRYLILAGEQAQVAVRAVQLLSKHRVVSEADLTFTGENQDDKFANQLAVGDVNGDTYADLYIGAPSWPRGGNTGRGYDDALRSPLAVQLGLPLAGWGLVYYGTLTSLLLGWTVGETFRFEATTAAFLLALAAAFGSVVLFVVMVTDLSPFCPMCAVVHAINLLLLFPLKRLTGRPVGHLVQAVAECRMSNVKE